MHLTAIAALMYASAPLQPHTMAELICQSSNDRIDTDACMQTTFDALAAAETTARVNERLTEVETEVAARGITMTFTALTWAFENSIHALTKLKNETSTAWYW